MHNKNRISYLRLPCLVTAKPFTPSEYANYFLSDLNVYAAKTLNIRLCEHSIQWKPLLTFTKEIK